MKLEELYEGLVEGRQDVLHFEAKPTPHLRIDIDGGVIYLMQSPTKLTVGYFGEKSGLVALMNEGIEPKKHVVGDIPRDVVVGLLAMLRQPEEGSSVSEEDSVSQYFTLPADSVPVLTRLIDAICVYGQRRYVERVYPSPTP